MSMEKVGFDTKSIKKYLELSHNKIRYKKELMDMLNNQRQVVLDGLHNIQKNIDIIDYMIYLLKNI